MTRLDQLPRELIAQVGIQGDALSTLNLSVTCRAIRQACNDSFVYKSILTKSKKENWSQSTLDIQAIAQRIGKNASHWVRYAVADQLACILCNASDNCIQPKDSLLWAPELILVKHPFLYHPCWRRYDALHNSVSPEQKWCTTVSTIAEETENYPLEEDFAILRGQTLTGRENMMNYVQALRWTIIELRKVNDMSQGTYIASRRRPVPRIATPRISDLELVPKNLIKDLPLPFERSKDGWKTWNREHSQFLFDGLSDGVWVGYTAGFDIISQPVPDDPSLKDIQFCPAPCGQEASEDSIAFAAERCMKDKSIPFNIRGAFSKDDAGIYCFSGCMEHCKRDDSTQITAEWQLSLRLCEFGLIGYWGRGDLKSHLNREGTVWLWKLGSKD